MKPGKRTAVPYAVRCRCGTMIPQGGLAAWDSRERLRYDCAKCMPRLAPKENPPDAN
jgi:predicted SprT family Zn-dependent metalloprotease